MILIQILYKIIISKYTKTKTSLQLLAKLLTQTLKGKLIQNKKKYICILKFKLSFKIKRASLRRKHTWSKDNIKHLTDKDQSYTKAYSSHNYTFMSRENGVPPLYLRIIRALIYKFIHITSHRAVVFTLTTRNLKRSQPQQKLAAKRFNDGSQNKT
jgi:hypothetical protein